jgi:hypothetical protein
VAPALELRTQVRGLLVRLALTSEARAGTFVTGGTGSQPTSRPPTGEAHPLGEALAAELERAGDDVGRLAQLLRRAHDELEAIVRRPVAGVTADSYADMSAEIVSRGEGFGVKEVSIGLRCTPTLIRRVRLAAGRHPETGRALAVEQANGQPVAFGVELVRGGYSVRAAAMIVGVPRSTLHSRARR